MQKRLSFARALLARPRALLVDEATHDLDPHAARVVRALTREIAGEGTAVVWATQRLEEIRDFAQTATLLRAGEVRYAGSVERLAADVRVRRHAVRVRTQSPLEPAALATHVRQALGAAADVELAGSDADLLLLDLHERESIGSALTRLAAAGIDVVACREVQSEIEEAFVRLTGDDA
jgi:ABC-type multidrug transport system ATPase subunit